MLNFYFALIRFHMECYIIAKTYSNLLDTLFHIESSCQTFMLINQGFQWYYIYIYILYQWNSNFTNILWKSVWQYTTFKNEKLTKLTLINQQTSSAKERTSVRKWSWNTRKSAQCFSCSNLGRGTGATRS